MTEVLIVCIDNPDGFPLMLTKHWFSNTTAGLLRKRLRQLILELFIDQAKDKECHAVVLAATEVQDLQSEKNQ